VPIFPLAGLCCFFQAEDGMRHATVTGVQTCALPIAQCPARTSRITSSVPTKPLPPSTQTFTSLPCRSSAGSARLTARSHRSGIRDRKSDVEGKKEDVGAGATRKREALGSVQEANSRE